MRSGIFLTAFALCAAFVPAHGETPSLVAIRDARIVTVSGATLEKGTVVLKDGLIADVGANVPVPAGAWVINGAGLTVYPGLIDALSSWGLPSAVPPPAAAGGPGGGRGAQATGPRSWGPEDRPGTTSWLKAADEIQPTDRRIETARSAGFTTAVTFPRAGLIAGHGAVVNLAGEASGEMVVEPRAGLYMTTSARTVNGFPNSLMGVISYYRQLWMDVEQYKAAKAVYEKSPQGMTRPPYDRALEGVMEAKRILLPATSRVELERMARFANELKTPAILYGAHEAYAAADALKKANVAVVLIVKWPEKARDGDPEIVESLRTLELREKAPTAPIALAKAGVPFAISSDGYETPKDILAALKKSVIAGLTKDQAIRALTLSAAEIYGVSDRLGSIDRGKIANLVVVKGDIFEDNGSVQMVFIDGKKYEPAPAAPAGGPGGGRRPSSEVRQ